MRHQIPAFDVTPWMSSSGASARSPHDSVGQIVEATATSPGAPETGAASAAATAGGRSALVAESSVVEALPLVTLEL